MWSMCNVSMAQATETPVSEPLISIDKKDQTFTQALKAVANQADITFKTHGDLPKTKRDISLKQVPLNQAMGYILSIYGVRNHAAAFNPETGTIMLSVIETSTHMPPSTSSKSISKGISLAEVQKHLINHKLLLKDPEEIEVLPPEEPGEQGISLAEMQRITDNRNNMHFDPQNIEILPPNNNDEKGTTQAEINKVTDHAQQSSFTANDNEVLPSDIHHDEHGLTLAEKQQIIDSANSIQRKYFDNEVLPPDNSSSYSLTQQELQQKIEQHNDIYNNPYEIEVLPPDKTDSM